MNAEPAPAALDALATDYEIIRELGRGGTAVVYLARERASHAKRVTSRSSSIRTSFPFVPCWTSVMVAWRWS